MAPYTSQFLDSFLATYISQFAIFLTWNSFHLPSSDREQDFVLCRSSSAPYISLTFSFTSAYRDRDRVHDDALWVHWAMWCGLGYVGAVVEWIFGAALQVHWAM